MYNGQHSQTCQATCRNGCCGQHFDDDFGVPVRATQAMAQPRRDSVSEWLLVVVWCVLFVDLAGNPTCTPSVQRSIVALGRKRLAVCCRHVCRRNMCVGLSWPTMTAFTQMVLGFG